MISQKLSLVHNDGFRQVLPVFVENNSVFAAELCEISFADSLQSFVAGSLITLYDAESDILLLELEGLIREGFIIQSSEIDVDFLPQSVKIFHPQLVDSIDLDPAADFWSGDLD